MRPGALWLLCVLCLRDVIVVGELRKLGKLSEVVGVAPAELLLRLGELLLIHRRQSANKHLRRAYLRIAGLIQLLIDLGDVIIRIVALEGIVRALRPGIEHRLLLLGLR